MKEGLSFDPAYGLVFLRLVEMGQMDECDLFGRGRTPGWVWFSAKKARGRGISWRNGCSGFPLSPTRWS
ncbi:MAG: hypothetical protein IPL78_06910 [Chloroflexi bacterium]|nr:hypothetical protein [Chloroflexota bacterium]